MNFRNLQMSSELWDLRCERAWRRAMRYKMQGFGATRARANKVLAARKLVMSIRAAYFAGRHAGRMEHLDLLGTWGAR